MSKHLNNIRNGSRMIKGISQTPLMNILNYNNNAPHTKIVELVKVSLAIVEKMQFITKTYLCNIQIFFQLYNLKTKIA